MELSVKGAPDLPLEQKVAVYRVAQEALNNVVKHSEAARVSVTLLDDGAELHLVVTDDGRGFDVGSISPDSFGLAIMSERAEATGGRMAIESTPGKGTVVSVVWTLDGGKESLG
jgi:signal transduction histidine kinase